MSKEPISISFCNQKSGIGKSTLTILATSWLRCRGYLSAGFTLLFVPCSESFFGIDSATTKRRNNETVQHRNNETAQHRNNEATKRHNNEAGPKARRLKGSKAQRLTTLKQNKRHEQRTYFYFIRQSKGRYWQIDTHDSGRFLATLLGYLFAGFTLLFVPGSDRKTNDSTT